MGDFDADSLVGLDRYPPHVADARSAIVERARDGIAAAGCAVLPGFLRPAVVALIAAEAEGLMADMLGIASLHRCAKPLMRTPTTKRT